MIYILHRHCDFSEISKYKSRPSWFSREKCFLSLYKESSINHIIIYDISRGFNPVINYSDFNVQVIKKEFGSEAKSFQFCLGLIKQFNKDDIVYFLEDDYLHLPEWEEVLIEGIGLNPNGYITLYDHPDKYTDLYKGLEYEIIQGEKFKWRTTPSTTNTFAAKVKTIKEDLANHFTYSCFPITKDHEKFITLGKRGRRLINPIPSISTHVENNMLASNINWETHNASIICNNSNL
jgi:hypothetical protein